MGTPLKSNKNKNINNASQELLFKYTSLTGSCLFFQFKLKKNFFDQDRAANAQAMMYSLK